MDREIIRIVQEFNARQKSTGGEKVSVSKVDERHARVELDCDSVDVSINYPRDKDSVWFVTEPEWLAEALNRDILSGKLPSLPLILGALAAAVARHHEASDLMSSEASNASDLAQSGLAVSGFYDDDEGGGRHFALSPQQYADLKRHVEEAQEMLGEERVQLVEELGAVKMTLNMYTMMDATLAEKLGFDPNEPVFVSFSYEKGPVPSVSCTQRVSPGYGVKNHLKAVLDHFFHYWNADRSVLKKVGRPPKELATQISGGSVANSNNTAQPPAQFSAQATMSSSPPPPPVKKQPWWKGLLGKKGAPSPAAEPVAASAAPQPPVPKPAKTITPVSEEKLAIVMDLGFDALGSMRALLETNADADKATMRMLGSPDKYQSTAEEQQKFRTLCSMGFGHALSAAALLKHNFAVGAAAEACLQPADVWTRDAAATSPTKDAAAEPAQGQKGSDKKSKKKNKVAEPEPEEKPDMPEDNVIFALLTYLQERLGHYSSYCVSCQAPHSCWNPDGGVVCCEALCVFQLEGSPLESLVSVRQCPFQNCEKLDLSTAGREFMGMPLQQICKDYNVTAQQLLEMMLHKYLPPEEMKKFLNDGLKQVHAKRVESCLNPQLCARFEHAWKKLREARKDMKVLAHVAYHGTSEAGIAGITSTGFLLNKLASGSGDNGWYGCGIYLSQHVQTAMGYCRGRKMLVCAVLMGKVYKCPGRMDGAKLQAGYDSHEDPSGHEWVVYDETHILPCYLVDL